MNPILPCTFDALESRCHLTSVSFTIDRKLSELAISASAHADHVGTLHLKPQADGLDTTPLTGTLRADVTSKGVQFKGGSSIAAVAEAGSYSPGDKAADFAVDGRVKKIGITLAKVNAAIRDLTLDLAGTLRRAVDGKGEFALRGGAAQVTGGTLDYKLDSKFGDANGSKSLTSLKADLSNGTGTITGSVGARVITVPIDVAYTRKLSNGATAKFTLKGQIVAHEMLVDGTIANALAPLSVLHGYATSAIFGTRQPIV